MTYLLRSLMLGDSKELVDRAEQARQVTKVNMFKISMKSRGQNPKVGTLEELAGVNRVLWTGSACTKGRDRVWEGIAAVSAVFDTANRARKFISANKRFTDVRVSWLIPQVEQGYHTLGTKEKDVTVKAVVSKRST